MTIGIIAYGSLRPHPECEIEAATNKVERGHETPFPVEFARASKGRDGAPTLVPFGDGAPVACGVIVLRSDVTIQEVRNMLFRRETDQVGSGETEDARPRNWIREWPGGLGRVEVALYTAFEDNVRPLTAERLAENAIASARDDARARGRDGISYLIDALDQGVTTPLSGDYERAILDQLQVSTLREALRKARGLP